MQLLVQRSLTSSVKEIKKIMKVFPKGIFCVLVYSRLPKYHSCLRLSDRVVQLVIPDKCVFLLISRYVLKRNFGISEFSCCKQRTRKQIKIKAIILKTFLLFH